MKIIKGQSLNGARGQLTLVFPYGISLGVNNDGNGVYFIICGSQYYYIKWKVNGVAVYETGWKKSNYINFGDAINRLKIWKHGNKLVFAINGHVVETMDTPKLKGSWHGFYTGKGQFALHNLYIKEFEDESISTHTSNINTNTNDRGPQIVGSGTGFVIDKRGYLATNEHVISDASAIYVCLSMNGEWNMYRAKLIKDDPINDLAIIKIDDPHFREFAALPYTISFDTEDVGSEIFTLGYPQVQVMGTDIKYTTGAINSRTGIQGDPTHYQISAHIDHGNSGGPLFNSSGHIIGVTDSGLDKATFGDVNYAVKSTYLKILVDALPIKLYLPNDYSISKKKRTEQIKDLSPYVALILIEQ